MKEVNIIWFLYQGWELGLTSSDTHWHFLVKAQKNLLLSEWRKMSTIFFLTSLPYLVSKQIFRMLVLKALVLFSIFILYLSSVVDFLADMWMWTSMTLRVYSFANPEFSEQQFIKELWLKHDLLWFWYFCQFLLIVIIYRILFRKFLKM